MTRALLTGASGFLGRHLHGCLAARGMDVTTAGRKDLGDAASEEAWRKLLKHCEPGVIFHLMGATVAAGEAAFDEAHEKPARALLGAALDLSLKHIPILVLGSAAEYGAAPEDRQPISELEPSRPVSAYGRSKQRATATALGFANRGLRVIVARLFNVFGCGMPPHLMPAAFLAQLRAGESSIRIGPLDRVRDYLQAEVAMKALADLAATRVAGGTVVNVCSGVGVNLRKLVAAMMLAAGSDARLVEDGPDSTRSQQVMRCVGDPSRLSALLGYRPPAPTMEDFWQFATAEFTSSATSRELTRSSAPAAKAP